jgi:hypothetical protein
MRGERGSRGITREEIIIFPQPATSQKLQCTQLTPKTARVVPPEDGHLMPETCRGSRHNKVIVKVKVY